jgi:putative ABC transport system permease protein
MAQAGAAWEAVAAALRGGLRGLSRSRGFAAAAILVLGLGVAAVTVAFAIADGVLLRPLPFKDSGRLVMSVGAVGPADFADIRERNTVFSRMTYAGLGRGIVRGPEGPERVWTMAVRPSFFGRMGVTPVPGRAFTPREYRTGGRAAVIISSPFRSRQFGADERFLGRSLDLNSTERVVVGAMPASFRYRFEWLYPAVSVWVPLRLGPGQARQRGVAALSPRGPEGASYFAFFIARLKKGLSVRRAQHGLDRVVAGILAAHPEDHGLRGLRLIRMRALWVGPAAKEVWPIFGFSLLFVVLGCVNLAGLMTARRLAREREAAVRAALGAGPGRLAALFLVEGLWIGVAGAAVGAALSYGAVRLFRAGAPAGLLPRLGGVTVNWRVVAFAVAASLLGALLAGLTAARAQRRTAPAAVLARISGAAPARGASGPSAGARGLVLAQSAIATVLLGAC